MLQTLSVLGLHRAIIAARRKAATGDLSGFDDLHAVVDSFADDKGGWQLRGGRLRAQSERPTPRSDSAAAAEQPQTAGRHGRPTAGLATPPGTPPPTADLEDELGKRRKLSS